MPLVTKTFLSVTSRSISLHSSSRTTIFCFDENAFMLLTYRNWKEFWSCRYNYDYSWIKIVGGNTYSKKRKGNEYIISLSLRLTVLLLFWRMFLGIFLGWHSIKLMKWIGKMRQIRKAKCISQFRDSYLLSRKQLGSLL